MSGSFGLFRLQGARHPASAVRPCGRDSNTWHYGEAHLDAFGALTLSARDRAGATIVVVLDTRLAGAGQSKLPRKSQISGEKVSVRGFPALSRATPRRVAFTLDCHDREVVEHVAVPRPLNGSDAQLLLDRSIWDRFGEVTLKTPPFGP